MILSTIARILSAVVIVYMFLCAARVLMSWLPSMDSGKSGRLIARATDPYLNWFRRFKIFSSGAFDFSPIIALAVLAVVNDLFTTASYAWTVSVGLVLSLIIGALWSAVAFVLLFFFVCALARLIAYAARWNSLHPVWRVIDSILNPVLFRINRVIYRGRIVNYLQGLITGSVLLLLSWFGGRELVRLLIRCLDWLPF